MPQAGAQAFSIIRKMQILRLNSCTRQPTSGWRELTIYDGRIVTLFNPDYRPQLRTTPNRSRHDDEDLPNSDTSSRAEAAMVAQNDQQIQSDEILHDLEGFHQVNGPILEDF